MTQEEKQLLLKDLCARLPYGVYITDSRNGKLVICKVDTIHDVLECTSMNNGSNFSVKIEDTKPYLRPMSSMTEEETKELWELLKKLGMTTDVKRLDWLNKKMFDIRGLIEKGLALEAPENMYKEK